MPLVRRRTPARTLLTLLLVSLFALGGSATRSSLVPLASAQQPERTALLGLTTSNRLVRFDSDRPGVLLGAVAIRGLVDPSETIVGIDIRPATGQLYGVSLTRLYTINPQTGMATPMGNAPFEPPLSGSQFGVDFNPIPDRIRVVSDTGQNLRLHPDTGAVAAVDARLTYAVMDVNVGSPPQMIAAAYSDSFAGTVVTTNYAIDAGRSMLVTQGSVNSTPVSPNTGQLFTVGPLGFATTNAVGFDIAPNRTAFASLTSPGVPASALYRVNLTTGAATYLGAIAGGEVLRGLAALP